jgi:hypothetical protein
MKYVDHPELRLGEKFILNVTAEEFVNWSKKANDCDMQYFRLGINAYCTNSLKPVDSSLKYLPMFGLPK